MMMYSSAIYALKCSVAEDYPRIDFSCQSDDTDWLLIAEMLDGEKPIDANYIEKANIKLLLPKKAVDVVNFEFRLMVSDKAKTLIGSLEIKNINFYKTYVNKVPFFHLVNLNILDCLDRQKSVVKVFPSDPNRVMKISKYVFQKGLIQDPSIFSIPEKLGNLFCTKKVSDEIFRSKLCGFRIYDIENPPINELIS